MPTKDCIKVGDKIYCWNKETKRIDVYIRKSINVEKCPPSILAELMCLLGDKSDENKGEGV